MSASLLIGHVKALPGDDSFTELIIVMSPFRKAVVLTYASVLTNIPDAVSWWPHFVQAEHTSPRIEKNCILNYILERGKLCIVNVTVINQAEKVTWKNSCVKAMT